MIISKKLIILLKEKKIKNGFEKQNIKIKFIKKKHLNLTPMEFSLILKIKN